MKLLLNVKSVYIVLVVTVHIVQPMTLPPPETNCITTRRLGDESGGDWRSLGVREKAIGGEQGVRPMKRLGDGRELKVD